MFFQSASAFSEDIFKPFSLREDITEKFDRIASK
jgi:hypothetical protein